MFVSPRKAAKISGVSESWIRAKLSRKVNPLPYVQMGGTRGDKLIDIIELYKYIKQFEVR